MLQSIGLLVLHLICLYFLRLLWKDKTEALKSGMIFTKMGHVSKKKSPRLFHLSIWIDFVILAVLYLTLLIYSISLLWR
ncbi:MAG TPA: hypothetical protein VK900_09475 [Anaerolineales bacterium]|nr:hypothetical protein [Anaerolineales bacterium]